MKQIGILFFIFAFLLLGDKCFAVSQFSASLTRMEKSLFGVDYSSQDDSARLKRLEGVVYGAPSSSPVSQRVDKLSKDLAADVMGQEIKPKKDTFDEEESGPREAIPKADSSVNYPAVDKLEKKVFNKDFKTTDINQRLANLEQNVFKKTYNDDLNSRVDRLKMAVAPDKVAQSADSDEDSDSNSYADPDDNAGSKNLYKPDDILGENSPGQDWLSPQKRNQFVPDYNSQNSVLDDYQGSSDVDIPLAALEKSVLRKSFPNDTVSNRLTRLEMKVFNSTFVDDDPQTRLDRVSSAYQAQKTSKRYDSNKFAQHSATAMQVGAILLMILAAVL